MTKVDLSTDSLEIKHTDKIVSLGSCFAESIGAKMKNGKFDIVINPNGILYNPASINRLIQRCSNLELYTNEDLILKDGIIHSWDHHGSIHGTDQNDLIESLNKELLGFQKFLQNADLVMITLGSSWLFKLASNNRVVANCHKQTAREFDRVLLSQSEVRDVLDSILKGLSTINPDIKVIFTVSPIRHIRDGLVANSRSKANLISACHEITDTYDSVHYFPAYEILQDELRDYRFYAEDMIHPSLQAQNIIWEKFKDHFFREDTQLNVKKMEGLVKAVNHRVLYPKSDSSLKFHKKELEKLERLALEFPYLDFSTERTHFEGLLK